MMNWYDRLPEWLRWILCWPISILFSGLVGWLILIQAMSYLGEWGIRLQLLHPVIIQVLFLYALYYTVPRGKLTTVLVFIILRSLFLVFFVIFTPVLYFELVPSLNSVQLDWSGWWGPLIGEIITLIASLALYSTLREDHNKSAKVPATTKEM